jgi:hypothetical protein
VGFAYKSGFTDAEKTPKLKDVGCESCHGPGSLHRNNPQDVELQKRMNQPWRNAVGAAKERAIEQSCRICHDSDNDVHWLSVGFQTKWQKIVHATPPERP